MSYNDDVIAEFRANDGKVGGAFAGAPLLLLHSTGAKTGRDRVSPMMFQAAAGGGWYVFASAAGADDHPAWYGNLVAHPAATIEVGAAAGIAAVEVTATELTGAEREPVWEQQKSDYPGFADYERKTTRIIPVLLLTPR